MAITDEAVWSAEERLWLEGGDAYPDLVEPDAVMMVPGMGFLSGSTAIAEMAGQPGWARISMTARHLFRSGKDVIAIAYRGEGERSDGSSYVADCTSTYHAAGHGWRLIQHQQTPVT